MYFLSLGVKGVLTLSLPRVINIKFLLQPHQKYYITLYEELGFSSLTRMPDDKYYQFSLPSLEQFYLQGWENVLFELGSERVKAGHSTLQNRHAQIVTYCMCLIDRVKGPYWENIGPNVLAVWTNSAALVRFAHKD